MMRLIIWSIALAWIALDVFVAVWLSHAARLRRQRRARVRTVMSRGNNREVWQ
jgi:hypothetical protein